MWHAASAPFRRWPESICSSNPANSSACWAEWRRQATLISVLAGLTRADEASHACGHDVVADYRMSRRLRRPQELVFDPFFTVRETLRIQAGYRHPDQRRVDR
jgi:exonuclease I